MRGKKRGRRGRGGLQSPINYCQDTSFSRLNPEEKGTFVVCVPIGAECLIDSSVSSQGTNVNRNNMWCFTVLVIIQEFSFKHCS